VLRGLLLLPDVKPSAPFRLPNSGSAPSTPTNPEDPFPCTPISLTNPRSPCALRFVTFDIIAWEVFFLPLSFDYLRCFACCYQLPHSLVNDKHPVNGQAPKLFAMTRAISYPAFKGLQFCYDFTISSLLSLSFLPKAIYTALPSASDGAATVAEKARPMTSSTM